MSKKDIEIQGPRENEERHASDFENSELQDWFFEHLDKKYSKDSTIDFYKRNIKKYAKYIERGDGHLSYVGKGDLKNFLDREAEQYAPKTVRHRYSAISLFYNTLKDEGLLDQNDPIPTERLDKSNVSGMSDKPLSEVEGGTDFHYLEPDEVSELIENVPAPELRNKAMVMLMSNTGLRASEIVRVRIDSNEYFDLDEKRIKVASKKLSDDIENNPEWITVYWRSETVSDVLDTYIQFERGSSPYADESPYLFPSKQSERLGYKQVNRIVKEAAENAGLQEGQTTDAAGKERQQITSHVLRHSYAMAALDNGMSIDEIRDNLHHSDISITMKYLRRHEEDRRRAVEKHGPQFG